jgi:hypothetical protein
MYWKFLLSSCSFSVFPQNIKITGICKDASQNPLHILQSSLQNLHSLSWLFHQATVFCFCHYSVRLPSEMKFGVTQPEATINTHPHIVFISCISETYPINITQLIDLAGHAMQKHTVKPLNPKVKT